LAQQKETAHGRSLSTCADQIYEAYLSRFDEGAGCLVR
jgi:hypothetical protein